MSELVACKYSGEFCVILALLHYLTQSCPTLCDPTDCSPPGFSVHGIFQARILEWVAVFFSRGSSQPRDRTQVSCIAGKHFNALSHQWSTLLVHSNSLLFWKMEGVLHNSTYWIFCAPFDKFFSFLTLACILFCFLVAQSDWITQSFVSDSATPWTVTHQAPLSMEFSSSRIQEWVATSFSRGSSRPRDWTHVSHIAGRFFTIWATEKLLLNHERHRDSWPPEEKNSIRGQRRGLIAQSFCVIKLY